MNLKRRLKRAIKIKTVKFGEIAIKWLNFKRNSIKISTYSKYSYTINKYLLPEFKDKSLSKLKYYDFNEFVTKLRKTLSPKTTRDILAVLKSILYYAEDEYEVIFKKKKIVTPRVYKKNLVILSKKERKALEKRCIEDQSFMGLGIILAMNTGMRIGEICALRWKNIDLEKRLIFVNYTLQRIYDSEKRKTRIILDEPKTQTSIRTIPISNKMYELLSPIKKTYKEDAFFLTGDVNTCIEPRRLQYAFKQMLSNTRMRKYKFHILRHTFATECIEVGMDVKSLSEILGHSNVNITLNRYVHSSYRVKKKFLEKL